MKMFLIAIGLNIVLLNVTLSQESMEINDREQKIYALIDTYSQARAEQDTVLLSSILTVDVDQLVSSGKWRRGKVGAMQGMVESSERNPGTRTLKIEQIRFLDEQCAITDARYEIKSADGAVRSMWSTFIVVRRKGDWKISAIRNMLPRRIE